MSLFATFPFFPLLSHAPSAHRELGSAVLFVAHVVFYITGSEHLLTHCALGQSLFIYRWVRGHSYGIRPGSTQWFPSSIAIAETPDFQRISVECFVVLVVWFGCLGSGFDYVAVGR